MDSNSSPNTCKEHTGICTAVDDIKSLQSDRRAEINEVWDTCKALSRAQSQRVPWFVFIPLTICVLGLIGLQWRADALAQREFFYKLVELKAGQSVIEEKVTHQNKDLEEIKSNIRKYHMLEGS